MQEKIQTGLRIPENRYKELLEMSERCGASLNAIVLMVIDIGMEVIHRGKDEFLRVPPRMSADKDE